MSTWQRGFWAALLALSIISPLVCGAELSSGQSPLPVQKPQLAIVIDDLGNNHRLGVRALALPGAVTFAFLPLTPFARQLAGQAHRNGSEVILHEPMENHSDRWLGKGALTTTMSPEEKRRVLAQALDSVPHAVGINNHTGSLLTTDMTSMAELMALLLERNLYFIDSLTTAESVAWQVAHHAGVPYLIRDVFLDNEADPAALRQQYELALNTARKQGFAVLIGHPYPQTLDFLAQAIPQLEQQGVNLVPASELLSRKQRIPLRLQKIFCHPQGKVDC